MQLQQCNHWVFLTPKANGERVKDGRTYFMLHMRGRYSGDGDGGKCMHRTDVHASTNHQSGEPYA